jgi:hypothetical protein
LTTVGTNWVAVTVAGGGAGYGDGTNFAASFFYPASVTPDNQGNYFICDLFAHTIRKMSLIGTNYVVTTLAGNGGISGTNDGTNASALFNHPSGIAVDTHSNVFVADQDNYSIRKVSPSGTNWVVTTIAGSPTGFGHVDGTNMVAHFAYPVDIARDSAGNLYVTDYDSGAIRKMTLVGTNWVTTTIAGGTISGSSDGTNTAAEFQGPTGIAFGPNGVLYVCDAINDNIRKLTPMGTNWVVTTIGGWTGNGGFADGTNSRARFYSPYAIAVDPRGNVFVADTGNQIIRLGQPYDLKLQIFPASNHLAALYWPTWSTNTLQTAGSLTNTVWTNLNGAVFQGASFVSTNGASNATAFFRLH